MRLAEWGYPMIARHQYQWFGEAKPPSDKTDEAGPFLLQAPLSRGFFLTARNLRTTYPLSEYAQLLGG